MPASLSDLWRGPFGDEYESRNAVHDLRRATFWGAILTETVPQSVLEVGCGSGANLRHLSRPVGVDVNEYSLARARRFGRVLMADAAQLPFEDRSFELVITCGLLIHIGLNLEAVMAEVCRVSSRHVLVMEYFSQQIEEVSYRGQAGSLFRRPYQRIYQERFGLHLVQAGTLGRRDGFDHMAFALLAQPQGQRLG